MCSGVVLDDLSDHFPVFASLSVNLSPSDNNAKSQRIQQIFDYKRIDEFNHFLYPNLQNIETESCPDAIANKIIHVYNEGINKFSYNK